MVLVVVVALLLLVHSPLAVRGQEEAEATQGEAAAEAAQGEAAEAEAAQGEVAAEATQGEAAQGETKQGGVAQGEEEVPVPEDSEVAQENDDVLDDSLFQVNIFECVAPKGEPAPTRTTPVFPGSVMTLCFRPKHESRAALLKVATLDFVMHGGATIPSIRDNQGVHEMSRVVCPFMDDPTLCIAAAKLDQSFFAEAFKVTAKGEIMVQVDDQEERVAPFEYKFETRKMMAQVPVDHVFMEVPATPPGFPCTKQVNMWLIMALLLTLLEFAFSPSSSGSDDGDDSAEANSKKKKKV